MTASDIANCRLINQQIAGTIFKKPEEIVAWMGAMQAQDYAMCKWAVGVRLPGATDKIIEQAMDEGKIIRTHIMRPTWHLVAANDVRWMMELTGPRLRNSLNANNKRLELTEAIFNKCNRIIEKSLAGGEHLTRQELMAVLQKNKIATNDLRSIHIMFRAEIERVVCNGVRKGKQFTYALFDQRVPKTKKRDRDAAVAELWKRYVTSHGPATVKDFVWWSGLTNADAKTGIELNKNDLTSVTTGDQAYWLAGDMQAPEKKKGSICFLPAFDEYMVSYKDRSAALHDAHFSYAISNNGIFKPIIVVDGQVTGIWDGVKKDKTFVTPVFFDAVQTPSKAILEKALKLYERFLGQQAELVL